MAVNRGLKGSFKILLGIFLILIALLIATSFTSWGAAAIILLKGSIIWILILIGILIGIIGLSDFRA